MVQTFMWGTEWLKKILLHHDVISDNVWCFYNCINTRSLRIYMKDLYLIVNDIVTVEVMRWCLMHTWSAVGSVDAQSTSIFFDSEFNVCHTWMFALDVTDVRSV